MKDTQPTRAVPGHRIMIVEDEGLIAEDLRASLSESGYEVVGVADSFDTATALAIEQRPDLAVLDIRLKGPRDGIELAEVLRGHNVGHVYLTSHSDEGTLSRAERTEPLGYILKPFRTREMLPVLRTALYRQACERRLRGLERWLSTVLRSIGDAVLVTDYEARITYMNPVAERLFARNLLNCVGHPLVDVMPIIAGTPPTPTECIATRCMKAAATLHLEEDAMLRRSDGSMVAVEDSAAPILDEDGSIAGAVVVIRDATMQRISRQRRREAEQRMHEAEKLESISMLATGLAHDLNNALTSILGNLSLCRDERFGDREAAFVEVERSARTAGEMCRRMLEAHGTNQQIAIEAVDVGETVRECVASERHNALTGVNVSTSLEAEGLRVFADRLQLRQVVDNLLRNACEATAAVGGGLVVVRAGPIRLPSPLLSGRRATSSLAPGHYVWVEVSDDGPGMPLDVAARVFEPFFTTKPNGNGLGLASANAIVRRHGGAIEVESQVEVGSVFRIFLPQARENDGAQPGGDRRDERMPTVMVVDDDESVRTVIRRLLGSRGWSSYESSTTADALQNLRDGLEIDAMIVDGSVANAGDGLRRYVQQAQEARPGLPILVVSGTNSLHLDEDLQRTAFLSKPFLVEELIDRLWRLIRAET